jgi:hypothetical protein
VLLKIADGVFENGEAVAAVARLAGPAGMVRGVDVALGVGHETKDAAGFVAEAGDVELSAVGVEGIGQGRILNAEF